MRGRWSRNGLDGQMSVGRTWVSRWSSWLGLWLACVMVLPAFAQGRPDIVWMRGGHVGWVYSVVVFAGWAFAGVGELGYHHSVVACFGWFAGAHPHGAHRWCLQRVVFAGWELAGVGELGSHYQVVACFGWFAGAHPHGAHR
jgi:hypothetical protein